MAVGLVNVDRPAAQDRFVLSTPATSPPDQLKVIVTLAGDAIIQVEQDAIIQVDRIGEGCPNVICPRCYVGYCAGERIRVRWFCIILLDRDPYII